MTIGSIQSSLERCQNPRTVLTPDQHWLPQSPVHLWHRGGAAVAGRGAGGLKLTRNGCCLISLRASAGPGFDRRGRQACRSRGATSQHHDQQRPGHALQTEGLQSSRVAGAHQQYIHLLLSFHLCSSLLLHQVSSLLPPHTKTWLSVSKKKREIGS